ncbi:MAG: hypothetical protein ACTHX2_07660 [Microbacterium sp.]
MTARPDSSGHVRAVRHTAVIGTAVLTGVALGAGGASLALWNDAVTITGEISSGYEYFAAGPADSTQPAVGGAAVVAVGADEAQTLADDEEIALALQTDSISQGNKGLRYELVLPDWGSGVFGAADVSVFPVESEAACTVASAVPTPADLSSTPVSADYSDTETPVTEFWCVVATLDGLPGEGAYDNTATVTARDDSQTEVTDSDSWNADVTSAIDAADEDDHEIEFRYQTFRPGEVTP